MFSALEFGETCDRHPAPKERGMDARAIIYKKVVPKPYFHKEVPAPASHPAAAPTGAQQQSMTAQAQPHSFNEGQQQQQQRERDQQHTMMEAPAKPQYHEPNVREGGGRGGDLYMNRGQVSPGLKMMTMSQQQPQQQQAAATPPVPSSGQRLPSARGGGIVVGSTGNNDAIDSSGPSQGNGYGPPQYQSAQRDFSTTSSPSFLLNNEQQHHSDPSFPMPAGSSSSFPQQSNQRGAPAQHPPPTSFPQTQQKKEQQQTQQQQRQVSRPTAAAASSSVSIVDMKKFLDCSQFPVPDLATANKAFKRVDFNGNGMLSLAELDKAVVEVWPKFNHKPAIIRAYKVADTNRSGFISKKEFPVFLKFLSLFSALWDVFERFDTSGDRRLEMDEFITGCDSIGIPADVAEELFNEVDTNKGGVILFDEFCATIAQKEISKHPTVKSSSKNRRSKSGPRDRKFLKVPGDGTLRETFERVDFNGNGMLSLAELDKTIVELWPQFNNKPAILRAYKAADDNKTGFLSFKEFRKFLEYIVVYQNLFAQFQEIDTSGDRRLTLSEFVAAWPKLMVYFPLSVRESPESIFRQLDKNGGGILLFDEFCSFFAKQAIEDFERQQKRRDEENKAKGASASAIPIRRSGTCHLCGKMAGSLKLHVPECEKKLVMIIDKFPTFLRMPIPEGPPPTIPRNTEAGAELYDKQALAIYQHHVQRVCPECRRIFPPQQFLHHFQGHHISIAREMELMKIHRAASRAQSAGRKSGGKEDQKSPSREHPQQQQQHATVPMYVDTKTLQVQDNASPFFRGVKKTLLQGSGGGERLRSFRRALALAAATGDQLIDSKEFSDLLTSFAIPYDGKTLRLAFKDNPKKGIMGTFSVHEVLEKMSGEFSSWRKQKVDDVIAMLDPSDQGYFSMRRVRQFFEPKFHPEVLAGRMVEDEALGTFLRMFDRGGDRDCTHKQFRAVLLDVSSTMDDDWTFEAFMTKCWRPPPLATGSEVAEVLHTSAARQRSRQQQQQQQQQTQMDSLHQGVSPSSAGQSTTNSIIAVRVHFFNGKEEIVKVPNSGGGGGNLGGGAAGKVDKKVLMRKLGALGYEDIQNIQVC